MNISNNDVLNAVPVLRELVNQKLPIKTSFKVMTIVEKLEDIIRIFELTKQTLVTDNTKRDEDGNPVPFVDDDGNADPSKIIIENPQEFQQALSDLLSAETDVEFAKLPVDELGDIKIEPEKLMSLSWLIDFGD